jgi:Fis family transcriptional regulator, factor for inversion stimulation protein
MQVESAEGQLDRVRDYFDALGEPRAAAPEETRTGTDSRTGGHGAAQEDTKPSRAEAATLPGGRSVPLRSHTEQALDSYFTSLNGHAPGHLYELVMREVEEPLFRAVLDYAEGNQSRAADILGINRGTLRKKLKNYGISAA